MSQLMNRRAAIGIAGGAASAASLIAGSSALAQLPFSADVEPRGSNGQLERLPTLDLESISEFSISTRNWILGDLIRSANRRAAKIMRDNGFDANDEVSLETAYELLGNDPVIMYRAAMSQRLQRYMWHELKREFHGNYDAYMSEMEAADNSGPGVLELNPGVEPEYAKHEIHMQPGGYTGDPFAGHIYHYGTNYFYGGHNDQDEVHGQLADAVPVPADGKVKRILDMGCSCGQQTVALKKRFPDAEVWGLDIGAPMVRYAHMRAVDLGADVNFRHALAEDTGFPDGHFDIVTSYLLHHEVPEEITYKIIAESARLVRPGGVYFPVDSRTTTRRSRREYTAAGQIQVWLNHRWGHERWTLEYRNADFFGEMERVGFALNKDGPSANIYSPGGKGASNIVGVKPA